jgi:hypothetical protein
MIADQLFGTFPNLRCLRVVDGSPPAALIEDLLRSAPRSLCLVELPDNFVLPKKVQDVLRGCTKLATLSANVSCVVALQGMNNLVNLRLSATRKVQPLWLGGWLPDLRRLCVEWSVSQNASWGGWLLNSLCSAAPNLTQLSVTCLQIEGDECCCDSTLMQGVSEVVSGLPNLQFIDVHCYPELLTKLPSLIDLKDVSVEVFCRMDQQMTCSAHVSVFKQLRPNVKACIRISSKPVTIQW